MMNPYEINGEYELEELLLSPGSTIDMKLDSREKIINHIKEKYKLINVSQWRKIIDLNIIDLRMYIFNESNWKSCEISEIQLMFPSSDKDCQIIVQKSQPQDEYWAKSSGLYCLSLGGPLINEVEKIILKKITSNYNDIITPLVASLNRLDIMQILKNFNLPGIVTNFNSEKIITFECNNYFFHIMKEGLISEYYLGTYSLIVNEEEYNRIIKPIIKFYTTLEDYYKQPDLPNNALTLMNMLQSKEFHQMPKEWLIYEYKDIINQMKFINNLIDSRVQLNYIDVQVSSNK